MKYKWIYNNSNEIIDINQAVERLEKLGFFNFEEFVNNTLPPYEILTRGITLQDATQWYIEDIERAIAEDDFSDFIIVIE